jgi:carbon monoxide dehydrogenase subunit G
MQLEHSFTVPLGIDDAYAALLKIEQVVACVPGAALDSLDGDEFTGTVKVKLGPIALTYKGRPVWSRRTRPDTAPSCLPRAATHGATAQPRRA